MEPSITTETTNTIPIPPPPPTKPDHEAPKTTNVVKITIPTPPIGKDTLSHSSSTGSSSPDSPLVVDPFKTDDDDDEKSVSGSPRKCSATEAPPSQEMERPAYRIPPSVFARNESKADMEWSVASNEELFSIHGENASFKNGRGSFWRPGDEDDVDDDQDDQASTSTTTTTGHMFSYTAQQPRCDEVMKSRELGLLAVATMKEVILECETHQVDFQIPLAMASQCSRGSSTSTKSFAFSSKNHGFSRTHSSVRSVQEEQAQCQPKTQVAAKSKSISEAEVEAEARPEPQPASATNRDQKTDQAPTGTTAHRKRWFPNFFSCCSL